MMVFSKCQPIHLVRPNCNCGVTGYAKNLLDDSANVAESLRKYDDEMLS